MVAPGGLLLFHGAGGDRDHRLFLAIEAALSLPATGLSLPVARCNFPYRDKGLGRRPPDRMPKLLESVQEHVQRCSTAWDVPSETLVLGGRSLGGRAASLAVADGLDAAGLVLLSYPLHPPGKPERLRTEHFGRLHLPVLLVQGDADPFGNRAEFDAHTPSILGPFEQLWLEKAGHDPAAKHDAAIVGAVAGWLSKLAGSAG
ncbi:MAG: dienelactone hydrolase [Actinomycetota bacterium]|nr:dienelactone hydrolase [Actinomycetota bacterium]